MKEKIHIAVCLDKCFVMPTGVMMISVCENNLETDIVFHVILDDNMKKEDWQDLEDIVNSYSGKSVVFYNANEKIFKVSLSVSKHFQHITKATYFRLFLPELLPQDLDKVLYLDGDLIVRHSILPLWNMDLGNKAIAAACDGSSGCIGFYNRLKYPYDLGYFNAGVLLVNLKYWREHHVLKDFESYMKKHADCIKYNDQDVLNVIFCDKKILIPIKYNLQSIFLKKEDVLYDYWKLEKEVLEARIDPCIVHFTTTNKPWKKYRVESHPFCSTWDKYQNKTKWKGIKYEHRTLKQRIRNYVGDILRNIGILSPLKKSYIEIVPID
jgi:lipopolysaccharide biosynthesis glycosyltransferase